MKYRNIKNEKKSNKHPGKEQIASWIVETEKIVEEEKDKVHSRFQKNSKKK